MPDFKLSAQLAGHDADVRAVCFPAPEVIISASRDNSVRVWRRTSSSSSSPALEFEASIVTQGTDFINSLAYLKPSTDYPEGLVVSGGKDTIIDVRKPSATPSDHAERLLIGHAHNVCTLDVSPKGTYLVSGGWDGQARVWAVGKWETEMLLEGHDGKSVWAVLACDEQTVITGCADQMIRVYDLRAGAEAGGECQPARTIYGSDVVRALCLVPRAHSSGADFASASNDGVIRLYKLDGSQVGELHGHESFIYSLTSLPTGELVSSGEDRTVRVWRDQTCVQTITHPAISVWSVAACQQTGDIVTGASDGMARVFTRSEERTADAEALRQFEESIRASSIPQQQVGGINKEKLPGPEFLRTKSGTKDGQVQMIKEDDGSVTAHTWSTGQQQWVNVGTVVDAVGSSGRKVEHNGQSYDFVFDVDIEDGKPPLKLPYNLSENPYERATKFIGDNELPMSYLDQVANFIVENTKGATLGQGPSQPVADPYGTESRYIPGEQSQPPARKVLPQEKYINLTQAKFQPILKKISSVNADLMKAGHKDFALNPVEEETLKKLAATLEQSASAIPLETSATAPPPMPAISEQAVGLVVKVVTRWPYKERLAGLDLLRCMAPSPVAASFNPPGYDSILDVALTAALDTAGAGGVNENSVMMAVRATTNLFVTEAGRQVAARRADRVVGLLECVAGLEGVLAESAAPGVKGPIGIGNRNMQIGLATAALNYAVLVRQDRRQSGGTTDSVGSEVMSLLINVLGEMLRHQMMDSEAVYRALVALGTLATVGEYCEVAKSLGAAAWVKAAAAKVAEPRVEGVAQECLALLQ